MVGSKVTSTNGAERSSLLADPCKARGCSTNSFVVNSIIQSWFVKISLGRRHALVVEDGAFSHKMDYFKKIMGILNLEGHSNCITGSKVLAILLNGWILPFGGVASGRVCVCSLRRRLVSTVPPPLQEPVCRAIRPSAFTFTGASLSCSPAFSCWILLRSLVLSLDTWGSRLARDCCLG